MPITHFAYIFVALNTVALAGVIYLVYIAHDRNKREKELWEARDKEARKEHGWALLEHELRVDALRRQGDTDADPWKA